MFPRPPMGKFQSFRYTFPSYSQQLASAVLSGLLRREEPNAEQNFGGYLF
jgi:hypothetical protein